MGAVTAAVGPYRSPPCRYSIAQICSITGYTSAEMSAFKPVSGGFIRHATTWLDRSSGTTTGWVKYNIIRRNIFLIYLILRQMELLVFDGHHYAGWDQCCHYARWILGTKSKCLHYDHVCLFVVPWRNLSNLLWEACFGSSLLLSTLPPFVFMANLSFTLPSSRFAYFS